MEFLILIFFMQDNKEFFEVANKNHENGYTWEMIDEGCREPLPNHISIKDGNGEVCFHHTAPDQ